MSRKDGMPENNGDLGEILNEGNEEMVQELAERSDLTSGEVINRALTFYRAMNTVHAMEHINFPDLGELELALEPEDLYRELVRRLNAYYSRILTTLVRANIKADTDTFCNKDN
jgi:flagellin-specific chaperone FliS